MGGHDAGATRHNPGTTVQAAPRETAWTESLSQSHLPTTPAIGPSRLYMSIGNYASTPAEMRVVAFSLANGTLQWERSLAYAGNTTPTLALNGEGRTTVFALSGQDNSNTGPGNGEVLALDPVTGGKRWRWTVNRSLSGPVVVADGRVYAHNISYGKAAVHALDATTGTELWKFDAGPVLHRAPTVAENRVFTSSGRNRLTAVRADDGSVEWEVKTKGDGTRPVVDAKHGHIFMGHQKGLEAFCASTGDRSWHLRTSNVATKEEDYLGVTTDPVVADDLLFVQTSDTSPYAIGDLGHLYGVDPATGDVQWSLENGRPASRAIGAGDTALLARHLPSKEHGTTGSPERPAVSDIAAIAADGSITWTRSGRWRPVAIGTSCLVAFQGDTTSPSDQVDIGCFKLN